jgi:hypothetical protein
MLIYSDLGLRTYRLAPIAFFIGLIVARACIAVPPSNNDTIHNEIILPKSSSIASSAPPTGQILLEIDRNCHVAITELQASWMKALLDSRRYQDVLTITDYAILAEPQYTWAMSFLLDSRITAELQMGRPMEALQDAKRLYNVAPMAETNAAMILLSQCLAAAYPNDTEIMHKFIIEQVEGSQTVGISSSVLSSIKLDPSNYIGKYKLDPTIDSYLSGEGNLLLLAGKPQDALEVFQSASPSAKSAAGHHINVNDIARAMKARDGTIAGANYYLRSQAALEVGK